MALTAVQVKNAKPGDKLSDGGRPPARCRRPWGLFMGVPVRAP